jgi:hypothetical protein
MNHRLEILRGRRWEGGAHETQLEERLMREYAQQGLLVLRRGRALLLAAALLVLGGLAGAGTATFISRFTVEETDLGDGRHRVRVLDGDKEVFDGVLEEDEALFEIEGGPILEVAPAEDPENDK